MSDLRRQPAQFPDRNRLPDTCLDSQLLVAHVGDVDSAQRACHLGELDDLVCPAERRGYIEQSRAESQGAIAHAIARQRAHPLQFACDGSTVDDAERMEPCPINAPRLGVMPVFSASSRAGLSGTGEKPSGPVTRV